MFRRSISGAALLGVLALTASACSTSTSTTASVTPATTGSSSSSSPSTTPSESPSPSSSESTTPVDVSKDPHAGVKLTDDPALPTTQGSVPLTIEPQPISSMSQNFNPFNGANQGNPSATIAMMYEPMLVFDNTNLDSAYKWLATDFAWSNSGKTLKFTVRDGVKFSDGNPLTAADVAFTYQVMKDQKAANYKGLPIDSASSDATTATINFTAAQYQNLYNIAGQIYIVEKKLYSGQSDLATWVDKAPVGTGPYTLGNFSAQGFTLKANPTYWQGKPPVPAINVPAYATNDVALQQLQQGKVDYAGNFIPGVEKVYDGKSPDFHHWFGPINTVNLVFNVNSTTVPALTDAKVRQAISVGFSRQQIAQQSEQGYEPPATSSSGILSPNFDSVIPAANKNDLKPDADQAKVDELMKGAGYAKDGKGFWAKDGKEVTFAIWDPKAFSDYWVAAQVMASELTKAGFNATAKDGVDYNTWNTALGKGDFDVAIHWGTTAPNPYAQFDGWLNSSYATVPRPNNYGGYKNPAADAALADYAGAGSAADGAAAIAKLAKIMADDAPVTPIMYGAGWFENSTRNYSKGWPTAAKHGIDPSPNPTNYLFVVLHLEK